MANRQLPTPVSMAHRGVYDEAAVQDLLNSFIQVYPNANFFLFNELAQDNITAFPGGGQANATPITGQTARLTVVATVGDSVLLPPSAAGLEILLINHGANAAQVYGTGADTINDVASGTGVSQMPFSMVIYSCATAGKWYTNGLASGEAGSFGTLSFLGGLTAHAGGGQGSALPITTMVSRFTTVATIGDSAVLPPTVANVSIGPLTVANAAANSMNVFPNGTDQINALGASAAFALAGGKSATFYSTGLGQWHAVLSA